MDTNPDNALQEYIADCVSFIQQKEAERLAELEAENAQIRAIAELKIQKEIAKYSDVIPSALLPYVKYQAESIWPYSIENAETEWQPRHFDIEAPGLATIYVNTNGVEICQVLVNGKGYPNGEPAMFIEAVADAARLYDEIQIRNKKYEESERAYQEKIAKLTAPKESPADRLIALLQEICHPTEY